jgi:chaperonin GroEL
MLVRDVLWTLHDQVGDGTASAAVLLQSVFNGGVRYLASGGNATRLKHHLEQGMHLILDELTRMSSAVSGAEQLTQVARSICYDPSMAKLLGEIARGRARVRGGAILGSWAGLARDGGRSRPASRRV